MKKTLTLIAAIGSIAFANAQTQPLTPGNLVIYKVGDGTSTLSAKKVFPVTLEEHSIATVLQGTAPVVQEIPLPSISGSATGSNHLCTASGTTNTEGGMTRSVDGKYLVFAGYDDGADTSTSAFGVLLTNVARVIGTIDQNGTINTSTAIPGTPFTTKTTGYSPRSVVSPDGQTFYFMASTAGIYSATLGATTATKVSAYSKTKSPQGTPTARSLEVYDGTIYASYQSTYIPTGVVGDPVLSVSMGSLGSINKPDTFVTDLPGIDTVYASTPTTKTSPYQFLMLTLPGGKVLYIADDGTNGALVERGIQKYSLVSGTWKYNGSIYASGVRGITGYNTGDTVAIFATSSKRLFGAFDLTGWNQSPIGPMPGDSAVVLDTATANYQFRGIAFAPGTPTNLAVTLKSFNGSLVNGYAKLYWSTASEINAKSFEIEKSADGKTFASIGSVAANNKPSSYEFTEQTKLAGLQYYRLRFTNKDGSYNYSSNVALNSKVAIKLGVYPNPVVSSAIISHPQATANASLKVIAINGKTIASYPVQVGATQTTISVSGLVKGSYIVSFENNNTRVTTQFVK